MFSLVTKMLKKLDLYAYSVQKWLYIEEISIKLNVCIFFIKDENFFDKRVEILGKVSCIMKQKIEHLYIIKIPKT